jgi:hypothetical protein
MREFRENLGSDSRTLLQDIYEFLILRSIFGWNSVHWATAILVKAVQLKQYIKSVKI